MSPIYIVLAIAALLPAAGLLFFIYKMDRFEKEPIKLLVGLFFLGVGSAIPAVLLEVAAGAGLDAAFGIEAETDLMYLSTPSLYLYYFIENFFGIALIEELCKWIFVFLITRKNKNFDCFFDGLVYSVVVSLGFAAIENVEYVFLMDGLSTAIVRTLTAVPAHCFFAVFMGYFYSRWHTACKAKKLEDRLRGEGVISPSEKGFSPAPLLLLSIVVPAAIHGAYDFFATVDSVLCMILFILLLIAITVMSFMMVHKLSIRDNYTHFISMKMVLEKHPGALQRVKAMPEYAGYFFDPERGVEVDTPIPPKSPIQKSRNNAGPMYGQPMNGQPMYGQPMNGQPMNGQPMYGQPMNRPPMNGQPMNRPPMNGQPMNGQPMNGQPMNGQPMYGQPMNGQPMNGQPMNGQPMNRPPMNGQPINGQPMYRPPVNNRQYPPQQPAHVYQPPYSQQQAAPPYPQQQAAPPVNQPPVEQQPVDPGNN